MNNVPFSVSLQQVHCKAERERWVAKVTQYKCFNVYVFKILFLGNFYGVKAILPFET